MKNEETARRLRSALSKANMTQQELADKSGVSKASISQYINGTHIPGNKKAGMMALVLGCSPLWLMGFDVDNEEPNHDDNTKRFLRMVEDLTDKELSDLEDYIKFIKSKR